MPRRELLTPTERVQLFAFPEDESELIRLATLARADLTYIRQHRGDHNRLGLAVQMVYLRHPSRVLPPNEAPFPPLLGIVAAQLKVTPAVLVSVCSARRNTARAPAGTPRALRAAAIRPERLPSDDRLAGAAGSADDPGNGAGARGRE